MSRGWKWEEQFFFFRTGTNLERENIRNNTHKFSSRPFFVYQRVVSIKDQELVSKNSIFLQKRQKIQKRQFYSQKNKIALFEVYFKKFERHFVFFGDKIEDKFSSTQNGVPILYRSVFCFPYRTVIHSNRE